MVLGRAGKIESWAACRDDAIRRDSFWPLKERFLQSLPPAEQARLQALSGEPETSAQLPGTERSERYDEEERLFMASLPEGDRRFLEGHVGLGNSQKAEVAWLEKMGYDYEELDVREFQPPAPPPRLGTAEFWHVGGGGKAKHGKKGQQQGAAAVGRSSAPGLARMAAAGAPGTRK